MKKNLIFGALFVFFSALFASAASARPAWSRNRATERLCADSFNATNEAVALLCENYYFGGGSHFDRGDRWDTDRSRRGHRFKRGFHHGRNHNPGYHRRGGRGFGRR